MTRKRAESVLVVDDDSFVLDSASRFLGAHGYRVISAASAAEALSKVGGGGVDVVLTDVRMPSVSGTELLERIHAADPETPVILMTAYADLCVAVDAIRKGAFDFIIKPFKPEQLVHSVDKAAQHTRLVRIEKEYRHVLEEFNRELETLIAERMMSLMALTVADRVRNPAAAIAWTSRRILEKEDIPDTAKEGIRSIIAEAEKLESIVRDFQALLRDRKSMFGYEDLNSIMKNILSIIREDAAGKGIDLDMRLSEKPLRINALRDLLGIAIFHILRNAIEATPEGGRVTVETSAVEDTVVLTISDTGVGIPEEDIDKIFDPFFSTKQLRFGMGLSLAKQIIAEHLAEIRVESGRGKGTAFRIIFPVRWIEKR